MAAPVVVIVGASVAGVRTAQTLRSLNFSGDIVLLSDESTEPYDKPPLSKGLLAGSTTVDQMRLLTSTEAQRLDIDLRLGRRATSLHLESREVEIAGGQRFRYDHLVIATGARVRPSPWGQPPGVHLIRTLDDSRALAADLACGGRLVVIGGGFVGAEAAATARSLGLEVTIVDPLPVPMERVLGHEIGERFAELHRRHGVHTVFGVGVNGITGKRGAFEVHLTNGGTLPADYVVVGIGAMPNDDWLAGTGLEIDNGVVCDEYCRAIGGANVYAVGDVARWQNPREDELTRSEHWTNAVDQAVAVAHNITHPDDLISYSPVAYVWSDQYDWKIRVAGHAGIADSRHVEVIGEDSATGRFAGLYVSDRHVLTGMVTVNWPKALVLGRKALADGTPYKTVRDALEKLAGPTQPRTESTSA